MWYIEKDLLPARHAERPRAGLFPADRPLKEESPAKRVVAFVDGRNLFHAAREAFDYTYPNYDALALAARVCGEGVGPQELRFSTAIPSPGDNPRWRFFWT